MKFCVAILFALVSLTISKDCSGTGGEYYDKGPACFNWTLALVEPCTPPTGSNMGGIFITLFSPQQLPWNYTSMCVDFTYFETTYASVNKAIMLVAYDADSNLNPVMPVILNKTVTVTAYTWGSQAYYSVPMGFGERPCP